VDCISRNSVVVNLYIVSVGVFVCIYEALYLPVPWLGPSRLPVTAQRLAVFHVTSLLHFRIPPPCG